MSSRNPFLIAALICTFCAAQTNATHAESLDCKKTDRVLILCMDDAGMSYNSGLSKAAGICCDYVARAATHTVKCENAFKIIK